MNLKVNIKNHTCYCFNDIFNTNDNNFDGSLLDEKSFENVWCCIQNLYRVLMKQMDILENTIALNI